MWFQDDFENTAKFKVGDWQGWKNTSILAEIVSVVSDEVCERLTVWCFRPVVLLCVPQVQLFSEPGFQGSVLPLEDNVASLQDGVSVASCKVLAGRWVILHTMDKISLRLRLMWVMIEDELLMLERPHHSARADFRNRPGWISQRWFDKIVAACCSYYKRISGTQDLLQAVSAPLT